MKNTVPGALSGMDFLLARTTRNQQRWRDGEGASGSCLHHDVAAINKMHFRCERNRAATTPHKTNQPGEADRRSIARLARLCAIQRAMQGASQRTMSVNTGLPKARGGSADGCGHASASLGRWGDGGTLAGKRPPHKARSDNSKTRHRPARPCSKRRRGDALPAPFCCPSPEVMEVDLDLVAGFTRRAQDITASYANPKGGRFYRRPRFA